MWPPGVGRLREGRLPAPANMGKVAVYYVSARHLAVKRRRGRTLIKPAIRAGECSH